MSSKRSRSVGPRGFGRSQKPSRQRSISRNPKSKGDGASVKVVVRVRPANSVELKASSPPVVQVQSADNSVTVVKGTGKTQQRSVFKFDHVFGTFATQKDIFEQTLSPVVDDVLSGVESTVFAYGQTGTGKTYTMEGDIGNDEGKGVIPRAVESIFSKLKNPKYLSSDVAVSYLEIYNEDLTDLLSNKGRLNICANGEGKIVCKGLSQQAIGNSNEVLRVLRQAQQRRQIGETKMNKQSSRSHCLFTLQVRSVERIGDCDLERTGKLHLVDLAGSECAKTTGATGSRLRESQNINKSLLTLGRVISALRDNSPRIPYRDSKLTRLLSQALGGACRTCIIATVSPAALCAEESMSTLHYADRAHGIKNKAVDANVRMCVNGGNGNISAKDSATFVEMQNRLDYAENQMVEAQTALARQHETNVKLHAEMAQIAKKEAETQRKYDETCVTLEKTCATLEQTKSDLSEQTGFTKKLQGVLQKSVANFNQFSKQESEERKNLSQNMTDLKKEHTATIEDIRAAASTLMADLKIKNNELNSLVSDFSTSNIERIQTCISEQAEMRTGLISAFNGGFDKLTNTIEASSIVFNNAENSLATWGKETTKALASHLTSLEERLQQQERKVLETSEFFHRNLRSQLKSFTERQDAFNRLSKAAREHAALGAKHLTSMETLNSATLTNLKQLTADLEAHLTFVSNTRADRSRGQKDEELLASVEATSASLLAGVQKGLASLAVQRNLISGALDYHKAETADGVMKKQLDAFMEAYGKATTEENTMLNAQINAIEATTEAQVDGTIDTQHLKSIDTTAANVANGIIAERSHLASLIQFQEKSTQDLISKVMDGVRGLVTTEVMKLQKNVEDRISIVQGVNQDLEVTLQSHKKKLIGETEQWAKNNHNVADALHSLRMDSQALQKHMGKTKIMVGNSVDEVSSTSAAWGNANREVDSRMKIAIQQNDKMHTMRTELTSQLKANIATTTAEANTWAAAGYICDASLASASETIQKTIDSVAIATADHGRNYATSSAEAVEVHSEANAHVDAVSDLSTAEADAAKITTQFQTEMGALCNEVAAQHTQFTVLNSDVHASIKDAMEAGMAPRAAVCTAINQHKSEMQSTVEKMSQDCTAKIETLRACLKSSMKARSDASSEMKCESVKVVEEAHDGALSVQNGIDKLCKSIVDEHLITVDEKVSQHNKNATTIVDRTLKMQSEIVQKAILATTNSQNTQEAEEEQQKTEEACIKVPEATAVQELQCKEQEPQKDAQDLENTAPTNAKKNKTASKSKTATRKSSRLSRPSAKSTRTLRPRTRTRSSGK